MCVCVGSNEDESRPDLRHGAVKVQGIEAIGFMTTTKFSNNYS